MPETENTDHGMPLLLSFETARQQLGGVSARHLYNLIKRGQLVRVKLGRSARITSESVKKLATGK